MALATSRTWFAGAGTTSCVTCSAPSRRRTTSCTRRPTGGKAHNRMTLAQPPKNFTHGEILRWRRVGGLVLAEVKYEPGQRIPRHVHAHARFVLVLAGGLTEVRGVET